MKLDRVKKRIKAYWPTSRSHRIIAGTGGILFLWFLTGLFSFSSRNGSPPEKNLMTVEIIESEAQSQRPITRISAITEERRRVKMRAETNGKVIALPYQKGSRVKTGDTVAQLSLDQRLAKLDEAKALVEQRRLQYEVAQNLEKKAFRSKTNLADAKAKYQAAIADLESIQTTIKDTKLTAPFDGILHHNNVEIGSYVAVGDPVLEIVELHPLKVVGFISEKDMKLAEVGKSVEVDLSSGEKLSGVITYASSIANEDTRAFRVEAVIDNPDYSYKAGLTADILIPDETKETHLISAALLTLNDEGVLGVYAVNSDNKVEFYPTTLISHHKDSIWITGLPDKVRLITTGQGFVTVNQEVSPVFKTETVADANAD